MKKTFILLSCVALLAACNNSNNSQAEGDEKYYESPESDSADAADLNASLRQSEVDTNITNIGTDRSVEPATSDTFAEGEKLIAQSDCLACHQVDKKLVGPSYKEVAQKYAFNDKNVNYLSEKIIKGGKGVWGEVPMTPHPDMPEQNAQAMAKYILSLNN
ncbi:c-type cytochrome [Pontibacter ruber]|uniref:C-type cytochrome n=1 Tax=Pontibacter ruber TaxID=1343895 RepID=A0ABW5CQS6_9BACT|nr:c-type cytochrome [Pontibacter ruber]